MINAIVGQSGGPTAAINASLSGVIRACRESGKIDTLFGSFYGIQGIFDEHFCSLFDVVPDENAHRSLELTPASALGSCRKKLPKPDDEGAETYTKLFEIFDEEQYVVMDSLPITLIEPFEYTFKDNEEKHKWFDGVKKINEKMTPDELLEYYRSSYKIPQELDKQTARRLAGMRYEIRKSGFSIKKTSS